MEGNIMLKTVYNNSHLVPQGEQYPLLSAEEEQALVMRFTQQGDLKAAQQLVLSHLRYVAYVVKSYRGYGLPLTDLMQEGTIGLMKAVKGFRLNQGVRLVTYAMKWIKSAIQDFVVRNWCVVKIATTKAQRKLFFNLRRHKKDSSWLSLSEKEHIAEQLKVPVAEVSEMEGRLYTYDTSFDWQEEGALSPADYLAGPETLEPLHEEENIAQLPALLKTLDARARRIIEARWLKEEGEQASLKDLSAEMGISMERVRQLEQNALKKMREETEKA
jgi:RNA polymerase sigma-32 factor